ncbi:hypothetical protein BFS14_06840 [Serratia fonticola]|nr:hypothetical protein BFS14_06840 [Serratia fonticola]
MSLFLIFKNIKALIYNSFFFAKCENGGLLSDFRYGKTNAVENFTFMRILGKSHGVRLKIENNYDET